MIEEDGIVDGVRDAFEYGEDEELGESMQMNAVVDGCL